MTAWSAKALHHLDLPCGKRRRLRPGEREDALDLTVAQKRNAEQRAVVADARRVAEIVFRIGEHVGQMHRFPAQHHSAREGLAAGLDRMGVQESDDLWGAARFRSEPHFVAVAHEKSHE